jgi:hypothetical protein
MSTVRLYGVIGLEGWPGDGRCLSRGAVELPDEVPLHARLDGRVYRVGVAHPLRVDGPTTTTRQVFDLLGVPSEAFPILADATVSTDTAVGRWIEGRAMAGMLPCGMALVGMRVDLPEDDPDAVFEALFGDGLLSVVGGRLADVMLYDTGQGAWPQARMWVNDGKRY